MLDGTFKNTKHVSKYIGLLNQLTTAVDVDRLIFSYANVRVCDTLDSHATRSRRRHVAASRIYSKHFAMLSNIIHSNWHKHNRHASHACDSNARAIEQIATLPRARCVSCVCSHRAQIIDASSSIRCGWDEYTVYRTHITSSVTRPHAHACMQTRACCCGILILFTHPHMHITHFRIYIYILYTPHIHKQADAHKHIFLNLCKSKLLLLVWIGWISI